MIKECPVIENNDAVTVVRFGDTDVQFSSIAKDAKTVKVKYDNGKYSIVDHAEEPEQSFIKITEPIEINEQKEEKKTINMKKRDEANEQ